MEVPTTVQPQRPDIDKMLNQIAAIDPNPWRAQFDEEELILWFHADLVANPTRVVISLDLHPSPNELAAARFLVHSREYVSELAAYITALEAQLQAGAASPE